MPERKRQRQQRVRHDAGGSQNPVGASNRGQEAEKNTCGRPPRQAGRGGVAYAEQKEYESVTIMPDKEVAEPQKYHRPGVLSNWSRYEEISGDDIEDGEDYLLGEDFSLVLEQQAASGGGYLKLKGESKWEEDESSILASHGLGVLHVADLVAAMNTLPLYTQLNMPEDSLPESILEFYTHLAEDNKKLYQPNSSNSNECLDVNEKILQSLKINDSEPLDLTTEEPNTNQGTRNAVDIAMSLSKDFDQVPEDVDLASFIQEEPVIERQPSSVKQPSPARQSSPEKTSTFMDLPCAKELTSGKQSNQSSVKQPSVERTVPKSTQAEKQPKSDIDNKPSGQKKGNSSTSFDFGLPKKISQTNIKTSESDSAVSKVKASSNLFDVKDVLNVAGSTAENEDDEKSPQGPTVDLDAPEEKSKPVLLVNKSEAEDLEDWLDSMLDD